MVEGSQGDQTFTSDLSGNNTANDTRLNMSQKKLMFCFCVRFIFATWSYPTFLQVVRLQSRTPVRRDHL